MNSNITNNTSIITDNIPIQSIFVFTMISILLCIVPLIYLCCWCNFICILYLKKYGTYSEFNNDNDDTIIIKIFKIIYNCLFSSVISPKLNEVIIINSTINHDNSIMTDIITYTNGN